MLVSAELDHFIQQGNHKAVLLFPPVSSRLRYLIHRLAEPYNGLSSFSVGEGWQRRTVLCHVEIRLPSQSEESSDAADKSYSRTWRGSYNKKSETGRGRQNWRQRKDARPDRGMYAAKGKPWWKVREEQRIKDIEDSQTKEPEVRECHRYTYHRGQLMQVTKKENTNGQESAVSETGKMEGLDRAEESLVDLEVPEHGSQDHKLPKESLSSQDMIEKMDREMADAQGTFVHGTREEDQNVSDTVMEKCERAVASFGQENPDGISKVPDEVQDHTGVLIPSSVNELSKSLDGLKVGEKMQVKQDEEEITNISEELKDLTKGSESQRVVEKPAKNAEKLEKESQDLEENRESPVPVQRSQEIDQSKGIAEYQNVEKPVESHIGTHSKTADHEVRTEEGMEKSENTSIADQIYDTDASEDNRADITETADCGKVQDDAIIDSKPDNGCNPSECNDANSESVTGKNKLEIISNDVEMETTSLESASNILFENVCCVPSVDGGNNTRKDEKVQVSGGDSTESAIPESHLPADKTGEEDKSVTEISKTSISSMLTEVEMSKGNDEDPQKMLEQIMTEIIAHVSEKDVHIQPLLSDFSEFAETRVDHGRFGHIIEVYGFSSTLGTEDLMEPFQNYRDRGFHLQWVDQSHALGIFSSPEDAYAASCRTHSAMKFRPLSQGSRQSKMLAHERTVSVQPYKDRPPTDASVAKRMVNRALGQQTQEADESVKE
ncbi:R3H and coiled-coil domain-containing protein 1 [Rana temporaria]|uniref:R3H and coiled-coil domain-containing protein 1 n=1 Tax=Rana temporaria TaxID=8407 RepID=UPI001AAD36B1|nr:R3H and coiled-coil domain-containing protein 1 [Rana temporaria]